MLAFDLTRRVWNKPWGYIIAYRIETAKKLLLSTPKSIAEIAYECGFASSSAFICRFKAHTGKTPLVFRSEALKNF